MIHQSWCSPVWRFFILILLILIFPTAGIADGSSLSLPSKSDLEAASFSNAPDEFLLSRELSRFSGLFSSDNPAATALSMATGSASGQIQQWLSRYGTARIQLSVDRYGNWSGSSGDLLIPFYDNNRSILFIQGGLRRPEGRLTGNLGYGVRTFWDSGWMFGANVFFDDDFKGSNRRVGIGAEAWRDYLKLSVNSYAGTTQWHTSRDFDGSWQEKPADGYDIRAEGWLPVYPQLGGHLLWEQYYGEQVALFDKDHLQHNPHAITVGLDYSPVPLLTIGTERRQGRGIHDTSLTLDFHWSFGHDWSWQMDPANVGGMRTLDGSRYELVNRNNEIVLQYRKNPDEAVSHLQLTVLTDNSPADGLTRNVLQVRATNRNGRAVAGATIEWNIPASANVGRVAELSTTDQNGFASIALTSTREQIVEVQARSAGITATANTRFTAVVVSRVALSVTQDNALADDTAVDTVVATLTDSNGSPVPGRDVTWTLPSGAHLKAAGTRSDADGRVTVKIASTRAGTGQLTGTVAGTSASVTLHFTASDAAAEINSLTVSTDGSEANGSAINTAVAVVTDHNANPLAGQSVTWKASSSTAVLGQSAVTNSSGRTSINYTNTVAETFTLTATLANGSSAKVSTLFNSGKALLKSLLVSSGASASGSDRNTATVTVTDASGNVVSGQAVSFSVTGSAALSVATAVTDSNGVASVTLTDKVAETVMVTAKLSNGAAMTRSSTFVADLASASISVAATSGAMANGSATNTVTVTLKDRGGNALADQIVTLSTSGSAVLSATSGTTDSSGQVTVTLTDVTAETVRVTATLSNGRAATAASAFVTYTVSALTASSTSVNADGSTVTLTATVTDNNGTTVSGMHVAFTVTGSAVLSGSAVTTDSNGQAQVTLYDTTGETVSVTAKVSINRGDAGKTQSVAFIAPAITGVAVKGTPYTFDTGVGFPTTGYAGVGFNLLVNGAIPRVGTYTWSSNRTWAAVDSAGSVVLGMSSVPSSSETATITGRPSAGGGTAMTYTFTIVHWYQTSKVTGTITKTTNTLGTTPCSSIGSWSSADEVTEGAVSEVGKLYGEWRGLKLLPIAVWITDSLTAKAAGTTSPVVLRTGAIMYPVAPANYPAICKVF